MAIRSSPPTSKIEYFSFAPGIKAASEIPKHFAALAQMLEAQPIFEGEGALVKSKIIPLDNPRDAKICDIFSNNAAFIIGGSSAWHIGHFGCGNNQLIDSEGRWIRQGVALWVFPEYKRCSLEDLQRSYDAVLKHMTTGWVQAKAEDYPTIMFKENSKEFDLFIKAKPSLIEEDTLIRAIATKLGVREDISCNDAWLKGSEGYEYRATYLWIRKSALEKVVSAFGFDFAKSPTAKL